MELVWRQIPEFPNYEVDSYGRVRNKKTKRLMTIDTSGSGSVKLKKDGKTYERLVDSLYREAFSD